MTGPRELEGRHEHDRSRSPSRIGSHTGADARRHAVHLPDASGDRARGPGALPDMRHGARADDAGLDEDENPGTRDFRRRFWWTLPLTLAVLVLAMAGHRLHCCPPRSAAGSNCVLAAPVVLWAGWPFFVRWAQSIANRSPNMWTLIGTGVGVAFLYSVVATIGAGAVSGVVREHGRVGVYFEAAAVIVSLTLLGQLLELRARSRRRPRSGRCCGSRRRPRAGCATDGSEEDIR